ncbi:helix-turn-helix domain-containing protein [Jiella avicenniae]|uniref:AraC family transcriptional regulator n=1 Tax=Jiella avicenniae TaxID=2907202 RepID=A0A9X1P6Z2_9HYPH|nr:AraC family transcriptional regulator [Jiella avicenniae]MCE7030408.1 AraC family transcriptional regulator [Jiella avicenniae]
MSFSHSMLTRTEGIRATEPVRWRGLDGMAGVFWVAEGQKRATGYYVSPDPRIVVFFNEVASHVRMCDRKGSPRSGYRPMRRAIYVPAGMPLWTEFEATHRFSHLDLHIHRDRMLKLLAPSLGSSAAEAALRRPAESEEVGAIDDLARLLVEELSAPSRPAIYSECLVGGIAAALLDLSGPECDATTLGRLGRAQMDALVARFDEAGDRRLPVAEMAATVGLSETWFSVLFKRTTGQTPLQWQLTRRIAAAKTLLLDGDLTVAGVASQLGFADQAHFTRVFRQVTGETPAAWRLAHRALARGG